MRKYYHLYPTCPSCHAPHTTPGPVERDKNGYFICRECGAIFKEKIIFDPKLFPHTVKLLGEYADRGIPVVWGVDFNSIETAYMEWIADAPSGIYYITWPWNKVKFIPALVNEYLLRVPHNKKSRILIITEFLNNTEKNIYTTPSLKDSFKYMVYLKGFSSRLFDDPHIRKERNKFDAKKMLGKKTSVIRLIFNVIGESERVMRICPYHTITRCKNYVKKEFERDELYKLRKLRMRRYQRPEEEILINTHGNVDVIIEERKEYPKIRYRREWLWEILENQDMLVKPVVREYFKDKKKNILIFEMHNAEITLVDIKHTARILTTGERGTYDMIIFENFDAAVNLGMMTATDIIEHFKNPKDHIILLFSTEPHLRAKYWRYIVTIPYLTFHTWDNPPLLDALYEMKNTEPRYPNPLSSQLKESGIFIAENKINTVFEYIKNGPQIDLILKNCRGKLSENNLKYIKKYLYTLKTTPLTPLLTNKNNCIFSVDIINASTIISIMREAGCDVDIFRGEIERLDRNIEGIHTSPLGEAMINKSLEILNSNENSKVVNIVRECDYRKWKILIRNLFENKYRKRIEVMTWRKFFKTSHYNTNLFIISPILPLNQFNIYYLNVKKLIFVGYENYLNVIKRVWKRKIISPLSHPLIFTQQNSPRLLYQLLNNIIAGNESIQEDMGIINEEIDITSSLSTVEREADEYSQSENLLPGDRAYLLKIEGRYMLIPVRRSVLIKDSSGNVEEIRLTSKKIQDLKNKLRGKYIMMDPRGLYLSFKKVFLEYMFKYGNNVTFTSSMYSWKGFEELYTMSILWIIFIHMAINKYMEDNHVDFREASSKIARLLSESDITADNPQYIEHWWKPIDTLELNGSQIPIFLVEHPQNVKDVYTIFDVLSKEVFHSHIVELSEDFKISKKTLKESYVAARYIQKMRNQVFKGKLAGWGYSVKTLIQNLRIYISSLSENTMKKQIEEIYYVKIKKEAPPFTLVDNYKEICDIIG